MAMASSRELEAALQALGHRSTNVRQTAALRIRQMYERSGSAAILRRLVEALSSSETTRRLGVLALVNELIDVNEWSRVGTGAGRFYRLLRAAVERATSPDELAIVVRTLGHAVRAAGSAATDATDTELARALDWMAASPEAPRASFHRLGACLIVTELAERGGPLAASAVASRLQRVTAAVWVALCDEGLETRQAAIGTLRACISIACQRDGGVAAWFEAAIERALDALERHEALHSSAGGATDGGALEGGYACSGAGGLWLCSPRSIDGHTDSRTDSRVCSRIDNRVDNMSGSGMESRIDSRIDSRIESRIESRGQSRGQSQPASCRDNGRQSDDYLRVGDCASGAGGAFPAGSGSAASVSTPASGIMSAELHGCLMALNELLDVTTGYGAAHPDAGRSSRERDAADRAKHREGTGRPAATFGSQSCCGSFSACAGDVFFSSSPRRSPLDSMARWRRRDDFFGWASAAEPEAILEGGGQRTAVVELLTAAERRRVFELVWRLRLHESRHVRIAVLQVAASAPFTLPPPVAGGTFRFSHGPIRTPCFGWGRGRVGGVGAAPTVGSGR